MSEWEWAEQVWPEAEWISGSGDLALVAHCPRGVTVTLHLSREGAERARAGIDRTSCGGRCEKDHEVVHRYELSGERDER